VRAIRALAAIGSIACAIAAGANEVDDAISRALVVPARIYEQNEARHRQCLVEHAHEERLAAMSRAVVGGRRLVAQTREKVALMESQRSRGEKVDALMQANAARSLPEYEARLKADWEGYKSVGGPAASIEAVEEIASPCGPPPQRPTY
jgi:hypothetical protein